MKSCLSALLALAAFASAAPQGVVVTETTTVTSLVPVTNTIISTTTETVTDTATVTTTDTTTATVIAPTTATVIMPTPTATSYASGEPICGMNGFTVQPGSHYIHPFTTMHSAKDCIKDCQLTPGCKAVGYWDDYAICLHYNEHLHLDHLVEDPTMPTVFYDDSCVV
ncbi:hypothetical protein MMC13_008269 [Lambiella insularis]|nr:hypothetical protein [Lambiella insularis]